MSTPCFKCGVRTDVSCRHREASALPKPGLFHDPGKPINHDQHHFNYWARATGKGLKCSDMFAILAAQLR